MPRIAPFIFGLHDPGGEGLLLSTNRPGWVVVTAQASDGGGDFSGLANQGLGVIVRLNNGYGSDGTIPVAAQYDGFAAACANYVANSQGANIWIIGNETNTAWERPGNQDGNGGEAITPDKYAQCFAKCRAAIRGAPGHIDDLIAPAPPGPWNTQTAYPGNPSGDWIQYFKDILTQCSKLGAPPSAIALHTYTHGFDAALIAGEQMEGAFPNNHHNFRAYRDFMAVIPPALQSVPVFITETQPADPDWWQNRNIGWVQAAYAEINQWNAVAANQPIMALCLFRWQKGDDRWSISDKPAVQNDFRAALQNDYRTRMPFVRTQPKTQPQPQPQPVAAGWYPQAVQRPITLANYDVGRSGHPVTAIVLHIAAGPLTAVFPTFNNPGHQASAHFCIGKDGTVEQYVSITDTAYAVGMRYQNGRWYNPRGVLSKPSWQDLQPPYNPNLYTVSIEHEGQPDDQWTPQMYQANNALLQWLAAQLSITYVSHRTLIGHCDIDPVDRPRCPGPNVNYDQIAADANAAQANIAAIQATALEIEWMPINTDGALYKYAVGKSLGCPQTNEFPFTANGDNYVAQVFNAAITYVKVGDWGNVQQVSKPGTGAATTDPVAQAAIQAALQQIWMPINTGSALYKYAQANNLGCPQTDEFPFNAGDDYVGQVYVGGFVYVKKGQWNDLHWMPKPARP
ncbi:MAG: peptidoglycan recognition family protein [Anaerolineae bacterium]